MVVSVETEASLRVGTPAILFNEIYDLRSNSGETYDVDPRGERFLMNQPLKEDVSVQIRVVVNWFEELRKLIPTK